MAKTGYAWQSVFSNDIICGPSFQQSLKWITCTLMILQWKCKKLWAKIYFYILIVPTLLVLKLASANRQLKKHIWWVITWAL